MSRFRVLASLILLVVAAGCKAQTTPADLHSTQFDRRVELMVRSQYSVPQDYTVTVGQTSPSTISGYDNLPVTVSRGDHSSVVKFLISKDGKTLARLETFDLDHNPALHIDTAGRPIRGNPQAKVTVINFDDLECPYCARMHETLFPSTLDHYKGLVRFVYKDDPLVAIHPWAMHAAVDANCLATQNGAAYWNYVDYLHSHGDEITGSDRNLARSFAALDREARQEAASSKLDAPKLDACLAKQDESNIKAETAEGDALGVDGTPALFVNGERISGVVPQEQLWMVIDRALRAAGQEPPASVPAQSQPPSPSPSPSKNQPGAGK